MQDARLIDPSCWKPLEAIVEEMSPGVQQWLTHRGSLTKRLRAVGGESIVQRVTGENWEKPQADEAAWLNLPAEKSVFIRETQWFYEQTLWVTTRALMPTLQTIGKRSLGDLLFSDPHLQRGPFEFASLVVNNERSWARRSVFFYFGKPLLVQEIFFPSLLNRNPPADE